MNNKSLITNLFIAVAVAAAVFFISLTTKKAIKEDIAGLQKIVMPESLQTLQSCSEQIKTAEERKWELVKDKWLRVSDINSANWYVSTHCPINIQTEDWEELLRNAAVAPVHSWQGAITKHTDLQINIEYNINRDDIINAIREAADVNEVDPNE